MNRQYLFLLKDSYGEPVGVFISYNEAANYRAARGNISWTIIKF